MRLVRIAVSMIVASLFVLCGLFYSRSFLRTLPQGAGMSGWVRDVGPSAEESLTLPIGDYLRASARHRLRKPADGEDAQDVFRKGQAKSVGLGDEFGFQFGRQVECESHGYPL